MITSLELNNFKRHAETRISLARLSILVGPNGAGKTSTLDALFALCQLANHSVKSLLTSSLDLRRVARRRERDPRVAIVARGTSSGEETWLRLMLFAPSQSGIQGEHRLHALVNGRNEPFSLSSPAEGQHEFIWNELFNSALLRVDPRRVSLPSPAATDPAIASDGFGLPTVLAHMKLADDGRWDALLADLKRLVPEVERFRTRPTTVGNGAGYELFFDTNSGADLRAEDMSDGTLVLLALLSVLHGPSRPRLLLLDSLETALHPTAQIRLTKLLRKLVEEDPSLQVVATTHSPYIVDCVPQEAVQVFAKAPDGTTKVRPLTEHPEAARYKGRLGSGQLWTLDDEEDWVLEGAK